jgi:hypothetical protein
MGLIDDLGFHFKNFVSSNVRDTPIVGDMMRDHLKDEILNNDNISSGSKSKVAKDLNRENVRQFFRHIKK